MVLVSLVVLGVVNAVDVVGGGGFVVVGGVVLLLLEVVVVANAVGVCPQEKLENTDLKPVFFFNKTKS